MSDIQILPSDLIEKIAAGEVVERPASVIKELIENSIDAGASRIEIEIKGGGLEAIRIRDDGCGMTPDNARLCIEHHATSKLRDIGDLERIATFGFRGEALSSIAAVSKLRLITRSQDSTEGFLLEIAGSKKTRQEPFGSPVGTEIEINDLFFNTPARRKFLKSERTESGHISTTVQKQALCHPGIGFKLTNAGRKVLELSPSARLIDRVADILGEPARDHTYPIDRTVGPYRISGLVGAPDYVSPNTRSIFFYVNNRAIRDKTLQFAAIDAYRSFIPQGSYPRLVLFVETPPDMIDVNVHPQKLEIRFREERAVRSLLYHAIEDLLRSAPWLGVDTSGYRDRINLALKRFSDHAQPSVDRPMKSFSHTPRTAKLQGYAVGRSFALPAADRSLASLGVDRQNEIENDLGFFSSLLIIGQLKGTYLLCQSANGLMLIDQHAAAERITFAKLKKIFDGDGKGSQPFLIPETVELAFAEAEVLAENMEIVTALGIEIEEFGGTTFLVKAAPAILAQQSVARLLQEMAAELLERGNSMKLEDKIDDMLATAACHSSLRANRRLTPEEMTNLLTELDKTENASSCPHGRPVYINLTFTEIEKLFSRS